MKRLIITSFDDGHPNDLKVAELLSKYKIPGVFYVPQSIVGGPSVMSESQIKELSKEFEIGAHSLTHQDLLQAHPMIAMQEIAGSKEYLERIIGKPVIKFSYPYGRYNEEIKNMVKVAGFEEARTSDTENIEFPKDPFETKPSIHISPHNEEWISMGHILLDKVVKEGGRFEMWGHSQSVEFEELEEFLKYMSYKNA